MNFIHILFALCLTLPFGLSNSFAQTPDLAVNSQIAKLQHQLECVQLYRLAHSYRHQEDIAFWMHESEEKSLNLHMHGAEAWEMAEEKNCDVWKDDIESQYEWLKSHVKERVENQ